MSELARERRSEPCALRKKVAVVAGVLLALGALVSPAGSVTRDVSLTADGPSPRTLTLKAGDRVQFVNNDSVPHQVQSQSGWQYNSGPVPPGRVSPETPPLTAPGTYVYDDVRGLVFMFQGSLVIPTPKPTPTPSPTPSRTPSASPTSSPTPSPTVSPVASSPAPSASPTVTPSPTMSPSPAATVPVATPVPTAAPEIRYGAQQALVQGSPHRYGLPALLAIVCLGGVLSLLLRYLLTLAPGVREED